MWYAAMVCVTDLLSSAGLSTPTGKRIPYSCAKARSAATVSPRGARSCVQTHHDHALRAEQFVHRPHLRNRMSHAAGHSI